MTTAPLAGTLPKLDHGGRVTQLRVALSEWTKLRSVRSTLWSLGVAVFITIALPCAFAAVTKSHWNNLSPGERLDRYHNRVAISTAGVNLSQLAIAVLAVLTVTAEYSTGMIRASFTAVPKRLPVLWAKLGVFSLVTLALTIPSVFIAYFASRALLPSILHTSLSDSGVFRTVLGSALYLTVIGIFSMALGAIVRNTAAGISAFVAIFFVIPPLLSLGLPSNWNDAINPYLPNDAARDIFQLTHGSHSFAPLPGFLIFLGYCAAAIAIAAILLRRRDT